MGPSGHLRRGALVLLLAWGCVLPCAALDPGRLVTQYGVSAWTTADGLPSNAVNAILQDAGGFLWLGTEDGLVRFDGVRFTLFDRTIIPGLRVNEMTALARTPDGALWIGTNGGGLVRMEREKFEVFTTADGLLDDRVWSLCPDGRTGIWIGTAADGLCRMEGGRIAVRWRGAGHFSGGVNCIRLDRRQRLWVGHSTGLCEADGDEVRPHPLPPGAEGRPVYATLEDAGGRLWIASAAGIVREEAGHAEIVGRRMGLPPGPAFSLASDSDGNLWVGTYGAGLARIGPSGAVARLTTSEGMPDDRFISLLPAGAQSLWVGTRGGGLLRLWAGAAVPFGPPEGLMAHEVFPLLEDRKGALWAGTIGGGLARITPEGVRTYTTRDGLSSDSVTALFEDRRGGLWAGTLEGTLDRFDGHRFHRAQVAAPGKRHRIACLLEDRGGRLWVGSRGGGLFWFEGGRPRRAPLPYAGVYDMVEEASGRVWLGTDAGLVKWEKGKFEAVEQGPELGREKVFGLHLDTDGTLWAATYGGGLVCLRGGTARRITANDGLRESAFYDVTEDGHGDLWLTSNGGIVAASRRGLLDFVENRSDSVATRLLGVQDGMRTAECSGGGQPAGILRRDGELVFPTAKGLVSLDPVLALRPGPAPPLVLEGAWVNGERQPAGSPLRVAAGAGSLEFRFSSTVPEQARRAVLLYRLEGYDREWTDAGTQRSASYHRVPPGLYRFRLRSASTDGSFPSTGLSQELDLRPPLYRQPLFLALLLTAMLAGAWGILRARMGLYRRRELQLEAAVASRTGQLEVQKDMLQALEARYRAVVEDQTEMVCRFLPDGTLTFVNGAMARGWGVPPVEAEGRSIFDLLAPAEDLRGSLALLTAQSPSLLVERAHRNSSAEARLYQWAVRAFFDDRGGISGFQAVGRDVTEQHRLEERLRSSQRLEAVGKLAGGIAHDFNNLLQTMLGATGALKLTCKDCERGQAAVRDVEEGVLQASHLTRQLLLFAHGQSTRLRSLDLNAAVREAFGLLRRMARPDMALELRLADGPLPVLADSGQMEQVLANLVLNACEASPTGGRILISTALKDGKVCLLVEDTGPGIPEEFRAHIFEPFFSTKEEGRGLGLSVVHGVVQRCGGTIHVEPGEGRGTRFRICLPKSEHSEEPPPSEAPPPPPPDRKVRVVLAEDSPGVREWLAESLRFLGYDVVTAASAAEAQAALDGVAADLLLTDVLLPDQTGLELARFARLKHPDLRLVLMSGYAREEILASEEPPVHFLAKPFTLETLERELAKALQEPPPPLPE